MANTGRNARVTSEVLQDLDLWPPPDPEDVAERNAWVELTDAELKAHGYNPGSLWLITRPGLGSAAECFHAYSRDKRARSNQ